MRLSRQLHADNVPLLWSWSCPCLYSVHVAKDALRTEKRFYLHRVRVGNEIRRCRAYKTKKLYVIGICVYI